MPTSHPIPIPPLLLSTLKSQHLPTPTPHFLHPIINPPSQRPPPLPALIATTKHRLLSTSLTTPHLLDPSTHSLPLDINNVNIRERILNEEIPVQVLDIEDIGRSRGELLGVLEGERLGERVRGREVIRVVDEDVLNSQGQFDGGSSSSSSSASQAQTPPHNPQTTATGPFKLLLQDHKGAHIYAFTTSPTCHSHPCSVQKIALPPYMHIGCKIMLLPGTRVCRGMVWIEGGTCVVLGGRVEGLDREWRDGWEGRVRGVVERERVRIEGERGGGGGGGG
ncbi:hypothetical protein EAF04_001506 [Stromatinia cepivora]|nr:hypothetical protein EAF04_001506 [Stromatinia cepivora]